MKYYFMSYSINTPSKNKTHFVHDVADGHPLKKVIDIQYFSEEDTKVTLLFYKEITESEYDDLQKCIYENTKWIKLDSSRMNDDNELLNQ